MFTINTSIVFIRRYHSIVWSELLTVTKRKQLKRYWVRFGFGEVKRSCYEWKRKVHGTSRHNIDDCNDAHQSHTFTVDARIISQPHTTKCNKDIRVRLCRTLLLHRITIVDPLSHLPLCPFYLLHTIIQNICNDKGRRWFYINNKQAPILSDIINQRSTLTATLLNK